MRVLHVIAEMGSGGAEAVVADLARGLVAAGHDVAVASSGGWQADRLAADGVRTVAVPLRAPGPVGLAGSALRLHRAAAARRPDVVHAHNVRATAAAVAAAGAARPRHRPALLTTVHGLRDEDYPLAARLLRWAGARIVAVSDDVADRLVRCGLPSGRVTVVENAVPSPPAAGREELRAEVRAELGLPDGVPVALCAARLAPPKRVDLLLAAWPSVPDAVLLVAGDGPDRDAVERAARDQDRVRVLGDRRDVARLLAAADLLVLPTDREGLPMTVLEAMAAGVPVVVSDVGGLRELPADAVTRVAPGSAAALGAAAAGLLADEAGRRRQAGVGQALVNRRFSSRRMGSAYESIYRELADRGIPS